eukprot:Platyproteum_vivax@DN7622_c0_g1_i7.p1
MNYLLLFASLVVVCFSRRAVPHTRDVTSVDVEFGTKGAIEPFPFNEVFKIRIEAVPLESFKRMQCRLADNPGLRDDLKALEQDCPGYTWTARIKQADGVELTNEHLGMLKFGQSTYNTGGLYNSAFKPPQCMKGNETTAKALLLRFAGIHAISFMGWEAPEHKVIVNHYAVAWEVVP